MEREALVTKTNAFKLVFIANCVKMLSHNFGGINIVTVYYKVKVIL